MANTRVQDILVSSIFGMVLGLVMGLWSSVFEILWLQNASREFLCKLFVFYSLGIIAIGFGLWTYAKKLGEP